MQFTHRDGCPLLWTQLRHLRITFVGFDGKARVGELVIHRDHAQAVTEAFEQLYEARWSIHEMRLVDERTMMRGIYRPAVTVRGPEQAPCSREADAIAPQRWPQLRR